jgi:hypothetical protein
VSEPDQADLLVRAAVLAAASGVERFLAFHLVGFRPTGGGHRFAWGVVHGTADGPKPAFAALRRLCRVTAGSNVVSTLATSPRTRAVVFEGTERVATICWQWSGGPGLFLLDSPPPGITVTDLFGAPSPGTDLRRPQLVLADPDRIDVLRGWLSKRLAPRYGEPAHPSSDRQIHRSKENVHVPS